MRQHLNEALLWGVLGLAVFAVGAMVVLTTRSSTDRQPAVSDSAAIATPSADAPLTSAPRPAPARKLTRAQIAQQKKAAAISAQPTRFEKQRADDTIKSEGGIPSLLLAGAIIVSPFWLFVIWRRWLRRRRAMIQGEGFEEGRIRARQRAGLI